MRRSILIILICFFAVISAPVFALDTQTEQNSIDCSPSSREAPIDYPLPEPGILPDHPLYAIKMLRDRILEVLITKPDKQIEFHILQADKFIVMASRLQEKGAGSTYIVDSIRFSLENAQQALVHLADIRSSGKAFPLNLKDTLLLSSKKRDEIFSDLACQSGIEKSDIETFLKKDLLLIREIESFN